MGKEDTVSLKYAGSEDKCFGIAGMTVALFIFNSGDYLVDISLDRKDMDAISFSPEFDIVTSGHISAKHIWKHRLDHFKLFSGMMISNLMSRYLLHRHCDISPEMREEMLRQLYIEGEEACQLENEETRSIFNNNYQYLLQAFRSYKVMSVVSDIARSLAKKHTLSRSELLEILN